MLASIVAKMIALTPIVVRVSSFPHTSQPPVSKLIIVTVPTVVPFKRQEAVITLITH